MYNNLICTLSLAALTCYPAIAQSVNVDININTMREVGGVSSFDRSKFITIHADHTSPDWNGGQQGANNFTSDLLADFATGRDVYFGRETGYISGQRKQSVTENSSKPGWASPSSISSQGSTARANYNNKTSIHKYEPRNATGIMCAQFNGFWPDGVDYNGWTFSQADTPAEPFGTATGDFMGRFLDHYYDDAGAQIGLPSPAYVEIINEPDWPILDWASDPHYGSAPASKIWDFHVGVADGIRAHNTNSLIGGFVTTFPDHDEDDFSEWNDEWKSFIDIAGTNMDFWSLHLYDFPSISGGQQRYRKGSNMEAMFDMIDYYSEATLGVVRPYVISEYGAQTHDYNNQGWSAYRDWLRLKSINSMVMSFMDRPHLMLKTIPFTVVKAEWGRGTYPYGPRLMRQANEPVSATGEWIYTDLVRFYDLWKNVKGTRVEISSADPDIQVDAYTDGDKLYVVLNNIVDGSRTIDMTLLDSYSNTVQSVLEKSLYWDGSAVVLAETNHVGNLAQTQVKSEGTVVLEYTMASAVNIDQTISESKYFASTYLKTIVASATRNFQINGVVAGASGEAVLRVGFARAHGLSKQPVVQVNGAAVTVPADLMGFESDDRSQFFGMLQIPVPYNLVQANNTVEITFPDSGGHVSTVALRTFEEGLPGASADAWIEVVGSDIILSFTNGPVNSYFALYSKTNLSDPVWNALQTGLPTDGAGYGSVTNPIAASQEFYRLTDSAPPPIPIIEFTIPDYSNGTLNGQQSWNAEAGWTVADAAGSGYASTPDNSSAAVLDEAIQLSVGQSYSLSINLQFGGTYATPTGFVYAFLGGLKDSNAGASVGTGSSAADANIQIITGTDNYRLLSNYATIAGAGNITGTQLNAGDMLQFDYELTLGADATSTTYTVRLQNLTDGTDTGTGTVTGIDASIYNALTGTGAYGFFQSITPGANGSGLSGVQVNSVISSVSN